MSDLLLWTNLEAAWQATGQAAGGRVADHAHWSILQDKPRSRVLRLEAPDRPGQILKIYAVPAHLGLRTLGVSSRANREFTVMMNAHRRGLPVARPIYWLEHRVLGGLRFSALALDPVEGRDLEQELRCPELSAAERLQLAGWSGALLGRLHRAGLYWATAAPRNLLRTLDANKEPVLAIDFPYATLAAHDITGSDEAALDLACLLRMRNGDLAFTGGEREALVLAYCEGSAAAARNVDAGIKLRNHHAWRLRRLKSRLRKLLMGSSSPGKAGRYDVASGSYRRLDTASVILES